MTSFINRKREAVIRHARASAVSKETKHRVSLHDRRALLAENEATAEQQDKARDIVEQAMISLGLSVSPMASIAFAKCYYIIPTTAFATMAVAACGDGSLMLLYNPIFTCELGVEGAKFVLMHEVYHVVLGHLRIESELRSNQLHELACEVTINHAVMRRMDLKGLPVITQTDPTTGKVTKEPTGVDPKKVFADYKKDLDEQGLDPVNYEAFVSTDFSCFAELRRMKNPPNKGGKKYTVCVHQSGHPDSGGNDQGDGQGVPWDQETIDRAIGQTLEQTMTQALKGQSSARQDLLDLGEMTEGTSERANKIWGNLGLGQLRGETVKVRKVEWWQRWLYNILGSKLNEGGALIYPRKRGGILRMLGHDTALLHRGPERTKIVVRAIDTSGSMSHEFLSRFFKVTGQTTGVEWIDLSFDAVVMPYKAGERVYGGGGTSFQTVVDYVEGRTEIDGKRFTEKVDAIIMVTDGWAPEVNPAEPGKWVWLITEPGDMWPESPNNGGAKMSCHRIDLPDMD